MKLLKNSSDFFVIALYKHTRDFSGWKYNQFMSCNVAYLKSKCDDAFRNSHLKFTTNTEDATNINSKALDGIFTTKSIKKSDTNLNCIRNGYFVNF